jgi:hypothetical protein
LEYKSSKYFLPLWNTKTKDFLTWAYIYWLPKEKKI